MTEDEKKYILIIVIILSIITALKIIDYPITDIIKENIMIILSFVMISFVGYDFYKGDRERRIKIASVVFYTWIVFIPVLTFFNYFVVPKFGKNIGSILLLLLLIPIFLVARKLKVFSTSYF